MNVNKILGRLILSFLLLNIVLLIINSMQNLNKYRLSNERIETIKGILSDNHIYIDSELPKVHTPKHKYFTEFKDYTLANKEEMVKCIFGNNMSDVKVSIPSAGNNFQNSERIYTRGNEKISFEGRKIIYENNSINKSQDVVSAEYVRGLCREFIKRIGKSKDYDNAYIEYHSADNEYKMIYYPTIKGLPVFTTYIQFEICAQGIRRVEMYFVDIDKKNNLSVNKEICPVDLVLFKIGDYIDSKKDIHITDVRLGYGSSSTSGNSFLGQEIIPVYKITIEGLDLPVFVNAYTNERVE